MRRWVIASLTAAAITAAAPRIDEREIVLRSVAANERDWKAAPDFTFMERDRTGGGTRTYEVSMIQGSPYQRLVAVNGRPLSAAQQAAERRKLDQVTEQRRRESAQERSRRIAEYQRERRRDHEMLNQLAEGFVFKLTGQRRVGERTVYILRATPKHGYSPPSREAKVLTGMEGTLWIDAETSQWVKVEADVIRPVSIEGFVATVNPGTRFEVEFAPVTNGIWLPTHFVMKSRARILHFIPHSDQADETYFDYKQATKASD